MSVVLFAPAPTPATRALSSALRAGLGEVTLAADTREVVRAARDLARPVVVVDLRAGGAGDADLSADLSAEARGARLVLPGTPMLALVSPGGALPPECDAVLTEPFYLVEVVRWCARASVAPIAEGVLQDLAAGLSHEIGNPLTALLLQLEMLRDDDSVASIREHLDLIEDMSRRIQQVVADVTLASELRPVRRSPTQLAELVGDARTQLSGRNPDLGRRLRLTCSDQPLSAEGPLVSAALADTWQYLLLAGERDDALAVSAGRHDDRTVAIRADARVPRLPHDAAGRLFTPLWARQALGLPGGLSLTSARAAFRRHGGELRVREQRGDALVIEALLPVTGSP